jgi:electron transfer flavoprotein alpha subunit
MANDFNILVVAQIEAGGLSDLSLEMLSHARNVAEAKGGSVSAVLLGDDLSSLDGLGQALIAFGADKAYLVEGALLHPYQADAWLPDLVKIISDVPPALVLIGHTTIGGDLAPRLAFRLNSAAATGCEEITLDGDKILLTRACYGGKARESVCFNTAPSIATIKSKTRPPLPRDEARTGEIIAIAASVTAGDIRTTVTLEERESADGPRLESAKVIVAGGGGLGGPEGFVAAAELAQALGGAVGASRVACDMDWCPSHYQVGLSGKTVAPELYIAIGISGAGQHMAGCANAHTIVAINNDPDAPIFRFSQFGVIGEYQELIPALREEILKLKA